MAAKYQVNWVLPIDLSSVRFIHLYRRKDDGSCSGIEDCCEYTLKGDKIFSDGSLPFANTYIDTLIDYGLYRYAVVSESFAGEISVCSTSNIDYKETSKLTILNFDPRGDIIGGTNIGTLEEKTIHEFEVPTNSLMNILYLIKPKIGWVINNITFENQDLPSNILRSFIVDRDTQIEINYKQQLFRLELTGEDGQFIALNPHDLEFVPANTLQTITAIPDDCHDFLEWQGGPEDQALFDKNKPSTIVTIDKSYKIHAIGEARKHLVTVNKNNDIAGEVTESFEYGCDEDVRITADANEGYRFKRWEIKGGLSNIIYPEELQAEYGEELDLKQKTLVFKVSGPVVIQAVFRRTFWLKISASNQWGITDPTTNILLDEEDNFYDVKAITNPGGIFLNWRIVSGKDNLISIFDLTSQTNQTVHLTGDVELVAVFSEIYDLKIKIVLSPELCNGLDCGQEVFELAEVIGQGEYNDGNNKPTISIQNISGGYEFVAWEIEEGIGYLDNLNTISEGPQELLIKGDVVLRAVIKLTPITLKVYPNKHTLGNTRPGKEMQVTVRDVIELSADVLSDKVVFQKWNIVEGAENIIPFDSDSFIIDSAEVQKIKVIGDVELEALFLKLHEIILDAEFFGTSKDSTGEGSLIDLHEKKTLVQINDQAKTDGLYTELDDVNISAICADLGDPCLFQGTKPGYFVFQKWRVEYTKGPSTFSELSDNQTITLKGDLKLVAEYYQNYKLEIFRANPDTTNGEYTGDRFYISDKQDKSRAIITARGEISSIDSRQYEFDRWRILQNEGEYLIDEDTPFKTDKSDQDFNLMSDLKLRVYFLIPFTLELQSNIPGSSTIAGFVEPVLRQYGDGTYRETQEVKIEAVINQELAYEFKNWEIISGNVVWPVGADITDLIQNIKISADTVLQANFDLIYYSFNCGIRSEYDGRGNITGTTANGDYTFFDEINIKAEANTGYVFKRFDIIPNANGDLGENDKFKTGLSEQTITLIDDFSIEPIFLQQYEVEVWITSDATTQLARNGIGVTRGGGTYDEEDNKVSLSADITNKKYVFERWEVISPSGFSGLDPDNPFLQTFEINSDMRIMAVALRLNEFTLSIEDKNAGQVNELTKANSPYTNEEIIKITATDKFGYQFSHWEVVSGAPSILPAASVDETGISDGDTNRDRSFRIQGDVEIRAIHTLKQYTLTVVTPEGGTVSGSGTYSIKDDITLGAIVEKVSGTTRDAYEFVEWSVTSGLDSHVVSGWGSSSRKNSRTKINIAGDLEITGTFRPIYYLDLNLKKPDTETGSIPTSKITKQIKEEGSSVEKSGELFIVKSDPSIQIVSSDRDWSFTEYIIKSGDISLGSSSSTNNNSITIGQLALAGDIFEIDVLLERWLSVGVQIKSDQSIDIDKEYPASYSLLEVQDSEGNKVDREISEIYDSVLYDTDFVPRAYTIFAKKRIKLKSTDVVKVRLQISITEWDNFSLYKLATVPNCYRNCAITLISGGYKQKFAEFKVSKGGSVLQFLLKQKLYNVTLNFKTGRVISGVVSTSATKKAKDSIKGITPVEAQNWSYEVGQSIFNSLGGKPLQFAGWSVSSGIATIPNPSSINLSGVELSSENVTLDAIWLEDPYKLTVEIKNTNLGLTHVRRGVWSGKAVKAKELTESTQTTLTGSGTEYVISCAANSPGVKMEVALYTRKTESDAWVESSVSLKNKGLYSTSKATSLKDPANEGFDYSGSFATASFTAGTYTKLVVSYSVGIYSNNPLMNGSAPSESGVWGLKGNMFKVTDFNKLIMSSYDGLPAYWMYHEQKGKPKQEDRNRVNKGMYLDGSIPGEQYIGWTVTYAKWLDVENKITREESVTLAKNQSIDALNIGTIKLGNDIVVGLCYLKNDGKINFTSGKYSGSLIFEVYKSYIDLATFNHNSKLLGELSTDASGNAKLSELLRKRKSGLITQKEFYDEHDLFLTTLTVGSAENVIPSPHSEGEFLVKGQIRSRDMFGNHAKSLLKNKGFMSQDGKSLLSANSEFKQYANPGWRVIQSNDMNSLLVAYDGGWILYYMNKINSKESGYVTEYKTGVNQSGQPDSMSYMPFSLTAENSSGYGERIRVAFKFTQSADFSPDFPDPSSYSLNKSTVKNIMYNHYPAIKKTHRNASNSDGVAIIDVRFKKNKNDPKSFQKATHYLRRIMWDMRPGITSFGNAISDSYTSKIIAIKVEQIKDSQRFNVYRYEDL